MTDSTSTDSTATGATSTWDETKWQGYGLLAGVVFVVLNVVSTLAPGAPPARDASAEKIAKYFLDNESGIKLAAILFGFGLIFGVWWLGSLWRVIGRLEPSGPRLALIAAVGFIMAGALGGAGQALFAAPALRADTLSGTGEFVWSVGWILFSFSIAVTAVHMLALAALIMWKEFLPVWMAYLALLSAVTGAISVIGAGTEAGFFLAFQLIGFLAWLVWVLLASILLYRRNTA
jgi:hypothetical protein